MTQRIVLAYSGRLDATDVIASLAARHEAEVVAVTVDLGQEWPLDHLRASALAGFVVFYGLDWVATVPPTVRLVADRFGKERVGPVFGWVFAAHQFGGSLAALGAGASRSLLGNYLVAVLVAGCLCLLAALLVIGLGGSARRETQRPSLEAAPPVPA